MLLEIFMPKDNYTIERLKQLAVEAWTSSIKIYEEKVRNIKILKAYKLEMINHESSY